MTITPISEFAIIFIIESCLNIAIYCRKTKYKANITVYTYHCLCTKGVSNIQPMGRIQPTKDFNVALEKMLINSNQAILFSLAISGI